MRASSTVARNASPVIRRCAHSKLWNPSRSAVAIISPAFSVDRRPSGWTSGDSSQGGKETKASALPAPNRASVAGFAEVNRGTDATPDGPGPGFRNRRASASARPWNDGEALPAGPADEGTVLAFWT